MITSNQMQKAAALRILLESYEPFVAFRERLSASNEPSTAAQQTKILLDLDAHREEVKDALISLGTYSHAFLTEGGGRYTLQGNPEPNHLEVLAKSCSNAALAEARIREQLGSTAVAEVSRDDVIVPLTDALTRARDGDARGAVVTGGNAVESFLNALATTYGLNLSGANGVNAKLDRLSTANHIPKKLVNVGKYLGHIRNAADHGVDPDVGGAWDIRTSTGVEYVFVACSFIATVIARQKGHSPEI